MLPNEDPRVPHRPAGRLQHPPAPRPAPPAPSPSHPPAGHLRETFSSIRHPCSTPPRPSPSLTSSSISRCPKSSQTEATGETTRPPVAVRRGLGSPGDSPAHPRIPLTHPCIHPPLRAMGPAVAHRAIVPSDFFPTVPSRLATPLLRFLPFCAFGFPIRSRLTSFGPLDFLSAREETAAIRQKTYPTSASCEHRKQLLLQH